MEKRGDQADETEQTAVLGGVVGEEVVGHEGEGEFHAGEEEEKGEVGEVEEEVGVCAVDGRGGGCSCWFLLGLGLGIVDLSAGRLSLVRQSRECLRQTEVEVYRLDDDQSQRHAGGCREGVGGHGTESAQPCAQGRTEGEGDREAGSDEGHGRAAL